MDFDGQLSQGHASSLADSANFWVGIMLGHSQPYHFVRKSSQCASKAFLCQRKWVKVLELILSGSFSVQVALCSCQSTFRGFFSKYELAGPKLQAIRVISKVTLSSPCLSPPVPSFSGICKVRKFLLNLSNGTQQEGRSKKNPKDQGLSFESSWHNCQQQGRADPPTSSIQINVCSAVSHI